MESRLSCNIHKLIPHLKFTKNVSFVGLEEHERIILLNEIFKFESVFVTDSRIEKVFEVMINSPLNFDGYHNKLENGTRKEVLNSDTVVIWEDICFLCIDRYYSLLESLKDKKIILKTHNPNDGLNSIRYDLKKYFKFIKTERLYPSKIDPLGIEYIIVGYN